MGGRSLPWCVRPEWRALRGHRESYRTSWLHFPECCVGKTLVMAPRAFLDVSSPAAMAEAEAVGKVRRLYINKADIMKHGLTDGCLGCRSSAERKRAQGHSEGCRARLEAEIAKSNDGRVRLTTVYLRGLARDEGRRLESAGAPEAIPVPPIPGEAQDAPLDDGAGARAPMDVIETSRKRSAKDADHETVDADRGRVQPNPGSMADDSMQEAIRDTGALGADAVALAQAYSPGRFQQRPGAFGLSAGVAMDLRQADQDTCSFWVPCAWPSPSCRPGAQHKAHKQGELLEQGRHHLEFACSLAGSQVQRPGLVLFEHP